MRSYVGYSHSVTNVLKAAIDFAEVKSLQSRGEKTSFKLKYPYEKTYYNQTLFGGYRRSLFDHSLNHGVQAFITQAASLLPPGISLTKVEYETSDNRSKKFRTATLEKTVCITFDVSQQYSWDKYFNKYAKAGLPFRDYLLENRQGKLAEIIGKYGLVPIQTGFYINTSCITDDNTYEYRSNILYFKDIGLSSLDNFAQCYGLILALLTSAGVNPDNYEVVEEPSYLYVSKKLPPATPVESW